MKLILSLLLQAWFSVEEINFNYLKTLQNWKKNNSFVHLFTCYRPDDREFDKTAPFLEFEPMEDIGL